MNDMELKLQELYGNYTKLDNGTYYVKTKNGNEIYIPETISQNQSMIAYAPGSGGFANASKLFKGLYSNDNPPSCVTVVSYTSHDYDNILNIGTDTINNLGGNVNNVIYASFSLSGITGIKKSENYLKENPNVSMSIISCDGCDTYKGLYDSYPTIKETQTPFIMLSNGFKYKYTYLKTVENGYNSYYLDVSNNAGHSQLNKDMINYLLLYAIGDQDEMLENNVGYKLYKGSNLEEIIDLENIKFTSSGSYAGYDRNIFKDVLKLKNLTFNNLDKYSSTDKIGNGYVRADFEFIQSSLNQIRSCVSKANIASKTPSLPVQGAGGLASAIANCISNYCAMTVNLYSKLAQETEATASYAQSIINLDLEQKNMSSNLNEAVTLGTTATTANTLLNNTGTSTPRQTPSSSYTTANTNNANTVNSVNKENVTNNVNKEITANTGNNTNNTQSSNTGNQTTTNTQNTSTTPTKNQINNQNDLTWNYKDGHNLTLTIENGIVKEMKFTYNYNSIEELNNNINNILVGQIDKKYIDKMTIIDKTVEVTIKPDFFSSLSLDNIKTMFFK